MVSSGRTPYEYLKAKPKIRILLLGSYHTPASTELDKVKNYLSQLGYSQTHLVRDFTNPRRDETETEKDYNLHKSEYWLPKADVPVFIFLPNVDNDGVEYELQHTINIYPDMIWRSIIGWSTNPPPKLTSLTEGLVNRWKNTANMVYFGTIKKLCEEVFGTLTGNILIKMYYRVFNREDGEWELDSRF
jgi:hypothetical protein